MANYQLGPVIGQLGGAEVQKIPVEAVADGGSGSEVIMHTVHVPEGETWLVVLTGDLNPRYANLSGPVLSIGEVTIGPSLPGGHTSFVVEATGIAEIALKRNNQSGIDTFTGLVYAVPLP